MSSVWLPKYDRSNSPCNTQINGPCSAGKFAECHSPLHPPVLVILQPGTLPSSPTAGDRDRGYFNTRATRIENSTEAAQGSANKIAHRAQK